MSISDRVLMSLIADDEWTVENYGAHPGCQDTEEEVAESRIRLDAFRELQEFRASQRWVSVRDRLPAEGEYVLIGVEGCGRFEFLGEARWASEDWGWLDRNDDEFIEVTHWRKNIPMEIPEKPATIAGIQPNMGKPVVWTPPPAPDFQCQCCRTGRYSCRPNF